MGKISNIILVLLTSIIPSCKQISTTNENTIIKQPPKKVVAENYTYEDEGGTFTYVPGPGGRKIKEYLSPPKRFEYTLTSPRGYCLRGWVEDANRTGKPEYIEIYVDEIPTIVAIRGDINIERGPRINLETH